MKVLSKNCKKFEFNRDKIFEHSKPLYGLAEVEITGAENSKNMIWKRLIKMREYAIQVWFTNRLGANYLECVWPMFIAHFMLNQRSKMKVIRVPNLNSQWSHQNEVLQPFRAYPSIIMAMGVYFTQTTCL